VLAVVLANGTLNALAAEDVVTVAAVDMAEVPDVFWFPPVFTPGRLMFAEPLKLTPPIVLAVWRTVAVAALPVQEAELPLVFWFPVVFTPGRLMFAAPLKLTPPIVRAVCSVVAVDALPVRAAVIVPAAKFPDPSRATIALAVFAFVALDVTVNVPPQRRTTQRDPYQTRHQQQHSYLSYLCQEQRS
jgi:hypothetical protein